MERASAISEILSTVTNDGERLIGDAAKNQLTSNPENTVFDAKRLIGRKFDDPVVHEDKKYWPFTIVNDKGKPKIEVQFKGVTKVFAPEEISAMVLSKMKEIAEAYLGKTVTHSVKAFNSIDAFAITAARLC